MRRRDISALFIASAAGVAIASKPASAQACTASCYPETQAESNSGKTIYTQYPWGSFRRYGADPTGTVDSVLAINLALQFNAVAFDDYPGGGTYSVSGVNGAIQFQSGGQILQGQGMGDLEGSASIARTILKYTGTSSSQVILSFASSTSNWSDCTVRDLEISGGGFGLYGVQVFNSSAAGTGTWRNRLENVSIVDVAGTGVYLGTTVGGPFANDVIITGCYIGGCQIGLSGAGAWYQVQNTTILNCSAEGVSAGQASGWTFNDCVFHENTIDFKGSGIQQASFSGCWFEESASGIYRASGAHSCSFSGCYLHTNDTTSLMNFGDAAGYHFFGGNYLPSATKSSTIVSVNPTATGAVFGQGITLTYNSSGAYAPLIIPTVQPGTGAVRSISGTLTNGQTLTLALGRGSFFIAANVWKSTSANVRTQATCSALLFDGDNEVVTTITSHTGSGGGESFTLAPSTNSVTLTYTGSDTVSAYLSGTGVTG